jgi:hypothetical protein
MLYMSKKSEHKVTNGGTMTNRQLLLLGGTALLLAACADSTAPGPQMRRAGVEASVKKDSTSSTQLAPTTTTMTLECRTGYAIAAGRTDSTCMDQDQ